MLFRKLAAFSLTFILGSTAFAATCPDVDLMQAQLERAKASDAPDRTKNVEYYVYRVKDELAKCGENLEVIEEFFAKEAAAEKKYAAAPENRSGAVQAPEQKVHFCADSISYQIGRFKRVDADGCKLMCRDYSQEGCLENETKKGWQIISTSPKEVLAYGGQDGGSCSCVGNQYLLKKEAPKPAVTAPPPMTSEKMALLEKEIELLKKENGMLLKELNELKSKAPEPKKK